MKRYGYNPYEPMSKMDLIMENVYQKMDSVMGVLTWTIFIWAISFVFTAFSLVIEKILLK